jgi:uncharacterized Fe-S center protein
LGKIADVYFGSIQHGKPEPFASLAAKFDKILDLVNLSTIKKGDKIAIKMHLGFRDGYQTLPVFFVRRLVDALKKIGGTPFVTDNPTSVYNAVYRGYTQETCGCPIIPIAGVKEGYTYPVRVDYLNVGELDMGGVLHDADALIDLSHVKGHIGCGFGGAIKNLAVGGYSNSSRWYKIHRVSQHHSYRNPKTCTPEHAKTLVESCPINALKYDPEKHRLILNVENCDQCLKCLEADKSIGCPQIKQENFVAFQELIAIAAKKVLDTFDDDKKFFLSFLLEITAYCDCWGMAQPCVVNDIGVLGSRDIVAIETAALDLIAKEGLIEKNIPHYFKNVNLDPNAELHPFQRIFGRMKNPYLSIEFAEKISMGSKE